MDDQLKVSAVSEQEAEEVALITGRALNFPANTMSEALHQLGLEHVRAIKYREKIVGGLAIFWMGHWFGGRNVPVAGISGVGLAPEQRGRGIASKLIRSVLEETHARGVPLSSLYPATVTFYRRAGYERAGAKIVYELPINLIHARERGYDIVAAEEKDHELIFSVYEQYARSSAGLLARSPTMWERALRPWPRDKELHKYLFLRDGQPEGYLLYVQPGWGEPLRVREMFALTRGAAEAILTFISDHRSVVRSVLWPGAPVDPFQLLLPEPQQVKVNDSFDWMLRIVDVASALSQRGYPAGLTAELHLEVSDQFLPHNNGRFVLEVANGRGSVQAGGRGDLRLDVRSLAALYSGHLSAFDVHLMGQLEASPQALALATTIFSGPRPWMVELF